jgi:aminoglycoside/choline kinase family phosphotransferase
MKGYGREFSPEDKEDWDKMIEGLMADIKEIRRTLIKKDNKT